MKMIPVRAPILKTRALINFPGCNGTCAKFSINSNCFLWGSKLVIPGVGSWGWGASVGVKINVSQRCTLSLTPLRPGHPECAGWFSSTLDCFITPWGQRSCFYCRSFILTAIQVSSAEMVERLLGIRPGAKSKRRAPKRVALSVSRVSWCCGGHRYLHTWFDLNFCFLFFFLISYLGPIRFSRAERTNSFHFQTRRGLPGRPFSNSSLPPTHCLLFC